MVTTLLYNPAPALQNFVNCYALRTFSVTDYLPKPLHAQPDNYFTFFLKKNKTWEMTGSCGTVDAYRYDTLISLLTADNGCVYFKGDHELFSVQFKGNGIFAIFGIPQKLFIDTIINIEDVLGNDYRLLVDKLENSKDISEMATHMNEYLLKKLLNRKSPRYSLAISETTQIMNENKAFVSVDRLAYEANMSIRNYERRFINEVGVTPKLYMRIARFYNAIENKIQNPFKSWTDICYHNGYFDQAHFIKDCKEFSSKTPDALFKIEPPPAQNFIKQ